MTVARLAPGAQPTASGGAARPLPLLLTASVACALSVFDSNLIGMALPEIARGLGADFAATAWMVSAFMLSFSSLLLPAGAIADRYGRRRVLFGGLGGFALGALLCGLALSPLQLCLARGLQGAATAFLLAPALAVIGHRFHGEAERNWAWAIWGAVMGAAMILAPLAGGLLVQSLGWRAVFLAYLPVCAVLAAATLAFVEESRQEEARALDPAGILLFAATMFGLTWGFIRGQGQGWTSAEALAGFAVGAAALAAFIRVERRRAEPMLDLDLFRDPRLIGGVWAMFAYAACAQVMASLLPLLLQNGLGFAPLAAGVAMLPFGLAMFAFPHLGRRLGGRLAPAQILTLGLTAVGIGNLVAGWGARLDALPAILIGMAAIGAGGGLLNGETQKAILTAIPRGRAGLGSGVSTTARFSGILLGFALLSGMTAAGARSRIAAAACPAEAGCPWPADFADAVAAGDFARAAAGLGDGAAQTAAALAREAYLGGFSAALFAAAAFAALSAAAVRALLRPR